MAEPVTLALGFAPWLGPLIEVAHPEFLPILDQQFKMHFLYGTFNEKEPNNTVQTGNDLGTFASGGQSIEIHGHVNGHTDLSDYFTYTSPSAGEFITDNYRNGNL